MYEDRSGYYVFAGLNAAKYDLTGLINSPSIFKYRVMGNNDNQINYDGDLNTPSGSKTFNKAFMNAVADPNNNFHIHLSNETYERNDDGSLNTNEVYEKASDYGGAVTYSRPRDDGKGVVVDIFIDPDGYYTYTTATGVQVEATLLLRYIHEFIGHGYPHIDKNFQGNAVENENIIRDELEIPRRRSNPNHLWDYTK